MPEQLESEKCQAKLPNIGLQIGINVQFLVIMRESLMRVYSIEDEIMCKSISV